jgi:flagellar motility protein MotE (MotC chaperone)
MKEIFQKDVQKKKKKLEKKRERSRFVLDKEKNKIIKMIKEMKADQEIASLSARKRISNKFRIIDI